MTRIRTGAVVAVAAILFAACQGTATTPAPTTAPTTAPASAPASTAPSVAPSAAIKEGGSLVVGLPGDMVLADPAWSATATRRTSSSTSSRACVGLKPGTLSDIVPVLADGPADRQRGRPDLHVQAPPGRQVP